MSSIKLICAGFGGQGVLTVGQMVAMMAMKKGYNVSWMPSYGPEMRGGTANCHVVIENQEVASPIIAEGITHLLAMNQPALDKFLPHCAQNAWVITHSALTHSMTLLDTQQHVSMDFTSVAIGAGNPKVQNMAAFGALVKHLEDFDYEDGVEAIQEKFGTKNPEMTQLNLQAYQQAYQKA